MSNTCQIDDCGKDPVVGLNGLWMCLEHYEAELKLIRKIVDAVMDEEPSDAE